ncbi:hypothetical protein KDN24_12090 [Bacillus sp. Bva_UNVM-123]
MRKTSQYVKNNPFEFKLKVVYKLTKLKGCRTDMSKSYQVTCLLLGVK